MSSQNTNEPCSILDQDGKCGETETLAIMQEFKRLYENKMTKIDSKAGGDNLPGLQAKLLLQREWIRDLTAQNELLVKAVEELENNATERVLMLESQLRSNAEKGTEGCSGGPCFDHNKKIADLEKTLKDKEKEMEELTMKYKLKNEEANAAKRSLMDIRNALTVEVAEKHDVILSLRRDVQLLEEQLRQSNKQILFKDDIIKELRKEIKVFKDEIKGQEENETLLMQLTQERTNLEELQEKLHLVMTERDTLRIKNEDLANQLKAESIKYTQEKEILEKKFKLSEDAYIQLEKANVTNTLELESSRRSSQALSMDIDLLTQEVNEKESIIRNLENELRDLKKQNKQALEQINNLNTEIQSQSEKIEEHHSILKHLETQKEIVTSIKNLETSDTADDLSLPSNKKCVDKESNRSVRFNEAELECKSSTSTWATTDSENSSDNEPLHEAIRIVKTLEKTTSTESNDKQRILELEKILERATKEGEIERAKHNREILNLKKTIEELEKSGQAETCKGHNLQNAQECVPFKEELLKLLEENKNQICENANLQMQLMSLTNELQNMQQIASEARELQMILQKANEHMHCHEKLAQQKATSQLNRKAEQQAVKGDQTTLATSQSTSGQASQLNRKIEPQAVKGDQTTLATSQSTSGPASQLNRKIEQQAVKGDQTSPPTYQSNSGQQELCKNKQITKGKQEQVQFSSGTSSISDDTQTHSNSGQESLKSKQTPKSQDQLSTTTSSTSENTQKSSHFCNPSYLIQETTVIGGSPPAEARPDITLRETTISLGNYEMIPDMNGHIGQKEMTILETNIYGISSSNTTTADNSESASQPDYMIKETNFYNVNPISEQADENLCYYPGSVGSSPEDDYSINPEEMQELQLILKEKTSELKQFEEMLYNTQEKLDESLDQNEELKNELQRLIIQLQSYEHVELTSGDECPICAQNEIDACRDNLDDLKAKFLKLKELLREKNDQCAELEAKYFMQSNMSACLKQQLEGQRLHYEGDISDLKHTINELDDKLLKVENSYELIQEEYKKCQVLLMESTLREAKLKNDLQNQKCLEEKLKNFEKEKSMCKCIPNLENEDFKKLLCAKEKQLALSISHVNELKAAAKAQIQMAREEIHNMKEEMHKVAHNHENVKMQNEKLQVHICNLKVCHNKFEEESKRTKDDMKMCLCELQAVKKEREILNDINQTLRKELKMLHTAYENLSEDFHHVSEELEVYNCNCICNCQQYVRQRGGTLSLKHQKKFNAKPELESQKMSWSLGSYGSESPPLSEFSNNADWSTYEEYEKDSTEDFPADLWLHRVETMTHQLKKSNKYWKKRLSDKDFPVNNTK